MPATLSNQAANTGTLTNRELSAASLTVEDATFTVEKAVGPVYAPYGFNNQVANTGTITNQVEN